MAVADLPSAAPREWGGDKYPGGFGATQLLSMDYWTLRARSAQLFRTNHYARGMIRRLVTNEINTGLHLEAQPEERVLGKEQNSLVDWTESVERRFKLWADTPRVCDVEQQATFGMLQGLTRQESLIDGDALMVLVQDPVTSLPALRLVNGAVVGSPFAARQRFEAETGNRIVHGVELDRNGRHVAYWIRQKPKGETSFEISANVARYERLPVYGESGRRIAWLVYGTDRRHDDVRGEPLLSIFLQSLREIDRYRDAVQRKAALNAVIAMFIKKSEARPGSRPMAAGGIKRRDLALPSVDGDDKPRTWTTVDQIPGLIMDELQVGEEPEGFRSQGTDEKFGDFEAAILNSIAWSQEIPPEILRLSYNRSYSASQASISEFKLYLQPVRQRFGDMVCQPVYEDWLLSEVLLGSIDAPGFFDAWKDARRYDVYGAWVAAEWTGQIKPAVDMLKLVRAHQWMIKEGLATRAHTARELNGSRYSRNVQQLEVENEQLARANAPLTGDDEDDLSGSVRDRDVDVRPDDSSEED